MWCCKVEAVERRRQAAPSTSVFINAVDYHFFSRVNLFSWTYQIQLIPFSLPAQNTSVNHLDRKTARVTTASLRDWRIGTIRKTLDRRASSRTCESDTSKTCNKFISWTLLTRDFHTPLTCSSSFINSGLATPLILISHISRPSVGSRRCPEVKLSSYAIERRAGPSFRVKSTST